MQRCTNLVGGMVVPFSRIVDGDARRGRSGGDWFWREAGTQLEGLARGGERAEGLQVGNGVILVELLDGLLAICCVIYKCTKLT